MIKDFVTPDSFFALDVRVGLVEEANEIPKQKGYLELKVSFGEAVGVRTVITNLGKQFGPESFVGRSFPFVLNLPPRTVAKLESQAMILASADVDHKVSFLVADGGFPGDVVV